MSSELIFYSNPQSRGRIVRWMLEEIGQPYRTEVVEYANMKAAPYRAINPMGKVPTLQHGTVVITECAAICAYLADAFPAARLAPSVDSPLRGPYYRWLFFTAGPFEAAVTDKALGVVVPPERQGFVGYGSLASVFDTLEAAVSHSDYLADDFSAADVYVGSQIGFGLMFGTIDKRPAFERYWARLSTRPAAQRARKIDDELIERRKNATA
jgi:glutathione S-transferase